MQHNVSMTASARRVQASLNATHNAAPDPARRDDDYPSQGPYGLYDVMVSVDRQGTGQRRRGTDKGRDSVADGVNNNKNNKYRGN